MATKRLYKSQEKKICGVCGGIAEYLGIDPTLIRLPWAIITCCTVGTGLIAYFVCAIVMADRPSSEPDWDNMKRANEYTESDKEFNSYFEKEKQENRTKKDEE